MAEDSNPGSRVDLYAVLNSLGEGVTLANPDGRIVFSNRAADQILGVGATDAAPEEWADYYGVFLPDRVTVFPADQYPLVRALRGEETRDVEMFVRNANLPAGVLIAVTGRPLRDAQGAIEGAAVVFRDVTALRQAEDELKRAYATLEQTQRLKEELSTFVVHDLKSPLAAILASTDVLLSYGEWEGEDLDCLVDIRDAARRLHRMVLDLLDAQLAEDGALVLEREDVEVRALLLDVRGALSPSASAAGQRIEAPDALPGVTVAADRDYLRRVLENLTDNCVKYGPAGGLIRLDAETRPDGSVRFSVRDEGPGVPPGLRDRIFDKYAHVERDARARSRDSRGLGLRFCRVVVEAHGGRVWVEDNEPKGACFCVELPGTPPG